MEKKEKGGEKERKKDMKGFIHSAICPVRKGMVLWYYGIACMVLYGIPPLFPVFSIQSASLLASPFCLLHTLLYFYEDANIKNLKNLNPILLHLSTEYCNSHRILQEEESNHQKTKLSKLHQSIKSITSPP